MRLSFEWDSRNLAFWRDDKAINRALKRAGGEALRFMRAGASRLIRSRKRFKVKSVNDAMRLEYGNLEWKLHATAQPTRIASAFPFRQTNRGVSVAINTGTRKVIKSAFVATMKSGHTGIFRREGRKRLPIEELYSTKVTDVFQDRDFIPFLQSGAQAKFASAFDRLIALEFKK